MEPLEDRRLLTVIAPVEDTSDFPYSATVNIRTAWDTNNNGYFDGNDETSGGSGAMISSHHALTAALVLPDDSLGFATSRTRWTAVEAGEIERTYVWEFLNLTPSGAWS